MNSTKNLSKSAINFLKKNSFYSKNIKAIKSDASKRKYYRLNNLNHKNIFMDSSAEKSSLSSFIKMTNWLEKIKLEAPKIIIKEKNLGYLVIKDLGKDSFSKIIKKNKTAKEELFNNAIKILIHIQKKPIPKFLNKYSTKILMLELNLFIKWYCKAKKINLNKVELLRWKNVWLKLINKLDKDKAVVLRDYHVDNLIWIKENKGLNKVGLLDYQDALIGHPAYDLVSLLQDVRLKKDFSMEQKIKEEYLSLMCFNKDIFNTTYSILGAQRSIKIIGIFYRLALEYKKYNYMTYIPNAWVILKKNLTYEELKNIDLWFMDNIPEYKDVK